MYNQRYGRLPRQFKDESWALTAELPREGRYGIPKLEPVIIDPSDYVWLAFSCAAKKRNDTKDVNKYGVHFFIYDYMFRSVYTELPRYAEMMKKFGVVCAPDFSMYADYPDAINIYNHYRSHATAVFWQRCGLTVIPTVNWIWESSYDWCFDGVPKHSTVALASTQCGKTEEGKRLFVQGYEEMLRRVEPHDILWYGDYFEECNKVDTFVLPSFSAQRWRGKDSNHTTVKKFLTSENK